MLHLNACPVCQSTTLSERFSGKTARHPDDQQVWTVSECGDCGLGFLNPRPSWEELAPYYSEEYDAYTPSHGAIAPDEEVIAAARASGRFRHIPIPEGKKLLDVGCGGGYFLRICSKLGATVQGVEPNAIAAERVRALGFPVFHGLLDEFETAERFDIITANQVLEHTPDPVSTLSSMKALLAEGGFIWLAVPNGACRWARLLGWRWDGADLPYHLLQFDHGSMTEAAKRAGLKVRRMYTQSVPWIVAYSMRRHLQTRYGIPPRLSALFVTDSLGARIGTKMDAAAEGDNLIVELVPG